MANTIRLKSGSGNNPSASDLVVGEVALRTDGNPKLFTKNDAGNVLEVGLDLLNEKLPLSGGTMTGMLVVSGTIPKIRLMDTNNNPDYELNDTNGVFNIRDNSNATNRFSIGTDGTVNVAGNLDVGAGIDVTGNITATGTIGSSNITITNSQPFLSLQDSDNENDFEVGNAGGLFRIRDVDAAANRLTISSAGVTTIAGNLDVGAGVDVTGLITANDIRIGDSSPVLSFVDTNADANEKQWDFKCSGSNEFVIQGINDAGSGGGHLFKMTRVSNSNGIESFEAQKSGVTWFTVDNVNRKVTTRDLDVTNNITVTGTVDGVDIAARNTLFGGLTSSSGVLTNGVTATTQSAGDNSTKVATTAYTDTAISNLVDSSPSTLNTLNELAAALGDDANFSTTVTNSIATKLPLAGGTLTGDLTINESHPSIFFVDSGDNPDYEVGNHDGAFVIQDDTNGVNRLVVNSDGHIDIAGNLDVGSGIDVTGASTFTGNLTISNSLPQLKLTDTDNNPDYALWNHDGVFRIVDASNSNATRFQIQQGGLVVVSNGFQVTGNITVSGTVDGRDLAADGTKLDGIESNATADQTASEILTLIKTVDGAGSGLNADTLDGVQSGSFVRSDQNDTMTGNLTLQNTAPKLNFVDTNNNSDYQLTNYEGTFRIYDTTNSSNRLIVSANGEIAIYKKLSLSEGLDVTGNIDITDGTLIIDNDADSPNTSYGLQEAIRIDDAGGNSDRGLHIYEYRQGGGRFFSLNYNLASGSSGSAYTYTQGNYAGSTMLRFDSTFKFFVNDQVTAGSTDVITPTQRFLINTSGVTVNGSIVVSGTVDGRDVASDGTKLDGIESNATADQTASEIKTLLQSNKLTASEIANDTITAVQLANGAADVNVVLDGAIVNSKVNASAAIAGTKISPNFGSQNVSATGYFEFGTAGGFDNISKSNLRIQNTHPTLYLNDTDTNNDFYVRNADGVFGIHDVQANVNRLTINSSGTAAFSGNLDVGAGLDVTGNITGTANLTGVKSIQTTGHAAIAGTAHTYLYGRGSQAGGLSVYAAEAALEVVSSEDSTHGGSLLLRTVTDGAGFVYNSTDNALELKLFTPSANDFAIHGTGSNVSSLDTQLRVVKDAQVELAHNGSVKLATSSSGVSVTGTLTATAFSGDGSGLTGVVASGSNASTLDNLDSTQFLRSDATDTCSGQITFTNQIISAQDGNRSTQGGSALVLRHATTSAMRVNHFIHDDFPSGSGTYYIQATEAGVSNDRNMCLQGYGGKVGIGMISAPTEVLHVTGNIAVTGTVDGRDVASDGSKLDGIESGATADQSASEILTLIKTVDGASSGLNADKLDGIEGANYLRSDTSDELNGALTIHTGGNNTYGRINGYANNNHFITIRGVVANQSSLSISGGHQMTFVEHVDAANEGWYFKTSVGGYSEIARIDGLSNMYLGGNKVLTVADEGSGNGIDADTLDGVEGANFLRSDQADTMTGNLSLHGNLLLTGNATTTNQSRMIDFTGFDKESTTDFSDRAYIQHTTNTGGFAGSVLVISSRNDTNDGIAFDTNGNNGVKINGNVVYNAANLAISGASDYDTLLRSNANDSFSGILSNTSRNEAPSATVGCLNLKPSSNGGKTGIILQSRVNAGSDFGYLWWYDDNNNYANATGGENGVLVIGVQNDADNAGSRDAVAIESSGNIWLNAGIGTGIGGANASDRSKGKVLIGKEGSEVEVTAFPSGTRMIFQQSSAPTGWTKDTTDTNQRALRVVSGNVSSGGNLDFTSAFASRGVSGTIANTTQGGSIANGGNNTNNASISTNSSSISISVNNHTLSTAQMPSHTHTGRAANHDTNSASSQGYPAGNNHQRHRTTDRAQNNNMASSSHLNTGSTNSHNHGLSQSSHNHSINDHSHSINAHSHSFTGSAHNHSFSGTSINLAVRYLDVIIAQKD